MDKPQLAEVLAEFALTLVSAVPETNILDQLVRRIADILSISSAGVTLIGREQEPRYVAASDDSARRFEELQTELAEGPCLLSYQTGKPVVASDLTHEVRFPAFAPAAVAAGLASVTAFPLFHGSRRFGALDLYRSTPGTLDVEEMRLASTLANVSAAYLINADVHEDAVAQSAHMGYMVTHDELTGLPNMRLLKDRIEHATRRARRSHAPAAILFLDVDRFKRVNDTYGHAAGDQLLCGIAERLQALLRPGDTVARIHGDEFVVLCEDLQATADVAVLVERIRCAFAEPFRIGERVISVTASVGIAFVGSERISEDILSRADRAMYAAKRRSGDGRTTDLRDSMSHWTGIHGSVPG